MATLQHTDELYHILEDEICALKILPGEALSENQLCKRFGVSRTPCLLYTSPSPRDA